MKRTLLLGAALCALCSSSRAQAVPPIPSVMSTTDYGPVVQNPSIIGRDGGFSVRLGKTSLWIFDDATLGTVTSQGVTAGTKQFVTNSASATPIPLNSLPPTLSVDDTNASGKLQQFIPFSPDEVIFNRAHDSSDCTAASLCGDGFAIWPQGAVADPATGTVYAAFLSFVRNAGSDPLATKQAGIAMGTVDASGFPQMERLPQGNDPQRPTVLWAGSNILFAGSMFIAGGYLYQFGETYTSGGIRPHALLVHEYLARVPLKNALNLGSWHFYAGKGTWSSNQNDAEELFESYSSNFPDIYYNEYLGEWMAVYLAQLDQQAYFRVARQPIGPWSAETFLFAAETPSGLSGSDLVYALRAHPGLSPDHGRTMVFHYAHDITAPADPALPGKNLPFEAVVFGRGG